MAPLEDYFRTPAGLLPVESCPPDQGRTGFFSYRGETCFGATAAVEVAPQAGGTLADASVAAVSGSGRLVLPFDLARVITNLRQERYVDNAIPAGTSSLKGLVRSLYYLLRPLMGVKVRRLLQRQALRDWRSIPFPSWPVDLTVDHLLQKVAADALRAAGTPRVPFIWFWPDGFSSAAIMTHDVETAAGRDFCSTLIDMEQRVRIPSSFQIVPEVRYEVPSSFIDMIRARGCEPNLHGLNHDGQLFRDAATFGERAPKINAYARQWGARGFRSPVLYRKFDWFNRLEFDYDMTAPNVAHLDPQRGGCCTVMPYFIGDLVELPVTTIQDYPLYNILGDYSLDLWKQQITLITGAHGLVSFIIHPDYTLTAKSRELYAALLAHLAELREKQRLWIDLPLRVAAWWRRRSRMTLVMRDGSWRVEGEGAEQAEVAYLVLEGSTVRYERTAGPAGPGSL